jgi:hypothetical protein
VTSPSSLTLRPGNNIDTVQTIAARFQSKYNQDLRKVPSTSSVSPLTPLQVLQEYTGSYYRQAMLTYLGGLQPLGSIEAEMALWLTPPGGEAQDGRIEFLAQALNNAKEYVAWLDADLLKKATKGLGTDERLVVDCLCPRTKSQLRRIDAIYRSPPPPIPSG